MANKEGMLKVSVISPEATLFEGEAPSVVAPAFDGEVGILPSHAPMVTTLGEGVLRIGDGAAKKGTRDRQRCVIVLAQDAVRSQTGHAAGVDKDRNDAILNIN